MIKVKILIEGYATKQKDGWIASSTTTLIEDSGKKIIVDPGINRKLLLNKLKAESLTPKDIDIVFMTHYHPDHIFLCSIFENALVVDGDTIYKDDKETEYEGNIPGTILKVILTPGHAHEHASILAETKEGKVVVAADLFWWTDKQKQRTDNLEELINRSDPFVKDMQALKTSRKKVLEIADFIIPGHGKMFKVKK